MVALRLDNFGGMQPAIDDRLLPEKSAVYCRDTFLYSGSLTGLRLPRLRYDLLNATTRCVFRIPEADIATQFLDASKFLEFDEKYTNVIKSPVIDDTDRRFYIASPTTIPKYNSTSRILADQVAWLLGVPAPNDAPIVTPSGGSDDAIAQARSYVYTYVTIYGEEGPPSDPTVANGYSNDDWNITMGVPDANDMGIVRHISKKRLYRTVTSSSGIATYFLVDEVLAAETVFLDDYADDEIALNSQLESFNWTAPPEDLQGFVQASNGIFAGWRDNEIWFSEPFRPHAWPSVYSISTEFPIVGLAVVGQSIVAATAGYPVVVTGINPTAMTMSVVPVPEPCVSRGSIISTPEGAVYMSPNGLIMVTPYGRSSNITESFITTEDLNAIEPGQSVTTRNTGTPHRWASLSAVKMGGAYMGFGTVFKHPGEVTEDADYASTGIFIDVGNQQPDTKLTILSAPQSVEFTAPITPLADAECTVYNLLQDFWTSTVMIIQNQQLYYYDFADALPLFAPYLWRSKPFQLPAKENLSALRVWFEIPTNYIAFQTATRNTDPVQVYEGTPGAGSGQYAIVRVYADGDLLTTREIRTSGELLRINSGQKYDFWQIELEGIVDISNVQFASTIKELGSV